LSYNERPLSTGKNRPQSASDAGTHRIDAHAFRFLNEDDAHASMGRLSSRPQSANSQRRPESAGSLSGATGNIDNRLVIDGFNVVTSPAVPQVGNIYADYARYQAETAPTAKNVRTQSAGALPRRPFDPPMYHSENPTVNSDAIAAQR
jgi:hypothetical protein